MIRQRIAPQRMKPMIEIHQNHPFHPLKKKSP